ncbi:MAG: membrane protein insertion efficiency factor YidD [Planctomycetota bacterium]|nr:membrane protein insertion efficiency factor YidD [Planctomycetota bacterium]MCX8039619.1 membrane protein insertion efficiency factor YidD [Planctomycetota bacterium]MDW8373086.1 membrane protein insertion efficiency factor YidD [Planctomycetota bacterium]
MPDPRPQASWLARLLIAPIRCYKRWISPLLPPACRYQPTCSVYMMEALATHGAAKGLWLGLRRLCRCHPWGGYGWDPVPPASGSCTTGQDHTLRAHSHKDPA